MMAIMTVFLEYHQDMQQISFGTMSINHIKENKIIVKC